MYDLLVSHITNNFEDLRMHTQGARTFLFKQVYSN